MLSSVSIFLAIIALAASAPPPPPAQLEFGSKEDALTPVVMWHGMGDSCCLPFSMGRIKKLIEKETGGAYVHSLKIGHNIIDDTTDGFLMPVNEQVEMACAIIGNDTNLKDGYHAVGFSQGGQFLRAVAQRCPNPPMKNLVTMGGQHQGVYGIPNCPGESNFICDLTRKVVSEFIYDNLLQSHLVQAEYWQDPLNHQRYVEKSQFIAEINNEPPYDNKEYAENLKKLEGLVLVKFTEDSMVEPRESSHFEFYEEGSGKTKVPLRDSPLYTEDRLGLKTLDEAGKLVTLDCPGDHLQFTDAWFTENIIHPYFV